jgi:hypothetical protein
MMPRVLAACVLAVTLVATVSGQQKTNPPVPAPKADDGKPVVLSGCLSGGPSSYTLATVAVTRAAHESAAAPVATSGAAMSYTLTPRNGIEMRDLVGKKVEVQGVLLSPAPTRAPSGESAKRKQDDSPDVTESANPRVAAVVSPKIAATSVRLVSPACQ